jgi:hypothetical protein
LLGRVWHNSGQSGGYPLLRPVSTKAFDLASQSVVDASTGRREARTYSIKSVVSLLPARPSSYVFADDLQLVGGEGYWPDFQWFTAGVRQ